MECNLNKTIIFLNLRFSDFYSKNLFKRVKEEVNVRFVAVLDQQFENQIGEHIAPYLDEIYYIPSQPKDGFLAEFEIKPLRSILENELKITKNINIVCSDEFNLLNAGRLRREYGLAGHTDEELLLYRDKIKMKERLIQNGIRVPRFRLLQKRDAYKKIREEIGSVFIIKPLDSCGSHGIYPIHNENDFVQFGIKSGNYSGSFEVEEFIQGDLYHVDSLVKSNVIEFICANEYTCPNHDFTKGKVLGSIPLEENHPLCDRLIIFARKCLKTLGANNLVNHTELFVTKDNEIIFLEISARPPGGLLNLTHNINFGVNLMNEDFFMQSGIHLDIESDKYNKYAFFAIFPLQAGTIVKLNNPKVNSRVDVTWHVKEGDFIYQEYCSNIVNKAAHAIFYNDNKNTLREDFEKIKQHQSVEVT
ncbi:MAG: ATP-grasp domain-containing protein [Gammaproteobacteria bacterium]|nr:MAG: ATP-grasp domain-containing protein [Gammaproteobacteria bacterium]